MQDFGVRGFRRAAGRVSAGLALLALAVCLVLSVSNLGYQLTATATEGEVVAVNPGPGAGADQIITVEYPDRYGQFRRFDESVRGEVPAKGEELTILYSMGPPVTGRVANYWWIWRSATVLGATSLALGIVAEELLRNRRRLRLAVRGIEFA